MINKILITAVFISIFAFGASAQKKTQRIDANTTPPAAETAAKPEVTESPRLIREQAYKNWLERDVLYLITPAEKESFLALRTDDAREQFIDGFWRRRDPNPKTEENEFRTEYFTRIAYANEHFPLTPGSITGWQSDRGKTYIMLGAPDQVETGRAPFAKHDDIAFEKWTYQSKKLNITFIDPAGDGEFRFLEKGSENLLGVSSGK